MKTLWAILWRLAATVLLASLLYHLFPITASESFLVWALSLIVSGMFVFGVFSKD